MVDVATRPASGIFGKIHFPSNTIDVPRADTPLTGPRGHRTRISPLPRRNPRRATRPGGPTHRQPGHSCPGPDAPSKRGPAGRYTLSANESVCRPFGPADCVANKNRSMNAPANDLLALRAKAHGPWDVDCIADQQRSNNDRTPPKSPLTTPKRSMTKTTQSHPKFFSNKIDVPRGDRNSSLSPLRG